MTSASVCFVRSDGGGVCCEIAGEAAAHDNAMAVSKIFAFMTAPCIQEVAPISMRVDVTATEAMRKGRYGMSFWARRALF